MNNYDDPDPDPASPNDRGRPEAPVIPESSATYAEAYAILHEIAERLRTAGPDDIETLIADYRRAMAAYRICAARLALIRQELDLEP